MLCCKEVRIYDVVKGWILLAKGWELSCEGVRM